MPADDRSSRAGACLILALTLGLAGNTVGCGQGGGQPAPFDEETQKKNQAMMSGGYRDAIYADHKAKAKENAAAKKKP
jgi:hypothetical protein